MIQECLYKQSQQWRQERISREASNGATSRRVNLLPISPIPLIFLLYQIFSLQREPIRESFEKPINNVRKGTRISREAVFAVHSSDTNISTAFVSSQSTKLRALYSGTGTGTGTRFFPRSIVPCFRIYTFTVEMKLLLRSLASISVTHFLQI